jgi:hypothetical protein
VDKNGDPAEDRSSMEANNNPNESPLGGGNTPDPPENEDAEHLAGNRLINGELQEGDSVRSLYKITKVRETFVHKFSTGGLQYAVTIRSIEDEPEFIITLYRILEDILENVTAGLKPADVVRLQISSSTLDYPISLPFIRLDRLTVGHILDQIERTIQSFEEFSLEESLTIHVTTVQLPQGSGFK